MLRGVKAIFVFMIGRLEVASCQVTKETKCLDELFSLSFPSWFSDLGVVALEYHVKLSDATIDHFAFYFLL